MEEIEEVVCNMCGSLMWYDEEDGIYICNILKKLSYNIIKKQLKNN